MAIPMIISSIIALTANFRVFFRSRKTIYATAITMRANIIAAISISVVSVAYSNALDNLEVFLGK